MLGHHDGVRLGVVTPVVSRNPRVDPPPWEAEGGIDDVVAVAVAAEASGYGWVGCPEHVAVPARATARRGGCYWDPLVTLGFVAARTTRIGLLPHVTVLGYHHPLALVKRYGTLDVVSGGRVVLGVGVGSLEEEFALLGADFADRGRRADDALRALRAAWGTPTPRYAGEVFRFEGLVVDPCGLPRHLPVWVGGRTARSLRRALALGDGWIPFGRPVEELASLLDRAEVRAALEARDPRLPPFEVVLSPDPPLDPAGDPSGTARAVEAWASAGATAFAVRVRHRSRDECIEQLAALATLVDEVVGFDPTPVGGPAPRC